jgi:hypothetical protein
LDACSTVAPWYPVRAHSSSSVFAELRTVAKKSVRPSP